MRRRLILHVGPHKTGSTYLQQRLCEDRDLLSARLRVVYPRTGQDVLFGHHSLARLFRDGADASGALHRLRRELEDAETGLLSSEQFSRLDRSQLARVRDQFADLDVHVVSYLRVRSELLLSHWAESVKHGRDHSLPEFLAHTLVAPDASPIINQGALLDTLSALFGQDHVHVLLYRPGVDLYAEFVETMLGSAAVPAHSAGRNAPVNASLPVYATDVLRVLQYMARTSGRHDAARVTARFVHYVGDAASAPELEAARRALDERAAVIDLRGIDRAFRHLDAELESRFRENFGKATLAGGFPDSRVGEVRYLRDLDAAMAGDLRDTLTRIFRAVVAPGVRGLATGRYQIASRFWRILRKSARSRSRV